MLAIEQLIGDLLLRHNCVIVPGFGGFVASQSAAQIDYVKGTILPPKKALLFNKQLINNDGLLIAELSKAQQTTFDLAQQTVTQSVNSWNECLRRGERVVLDRVGHLYLDSERNICFEQDRFFNLLLESYGLGKVQFVPEAETNDINETETKIIAVDFNKIERPAAEETVPVISHPEVVKRRSAWRYVAAACLLPVAFYSFWIPMKTDVLESGMLSVKDFNPFYKSAEGIYNPVNTELKGLSKEEESLEELVSKLSDGVEVFSYQFDEDLYIPVSLKKEVQQIVLPENVQASITDQTTGRFKLIVGCFGDPSNAENLVNKLRSEGFSASLAGEAGGLTRVSAGSASNEEEARNLTSQLKEKGYTAWILK